MEIPKQLLCSKEKFIFCALEALASSVSQTLYEGVEPFKVTPIFRKSCLPGQIRVFALSLTNT